MHKYFNYSQIFEAEQMGAPLNPAEMGTPEPVGANPATLISEADLVNYTLDLQLSPSDISALYNNSVGYIEKNEQSLVDNSGDLTKNKVIDIKIINSDNADASIPTDDTSKLVMTTTSTKLSEVGVDENSFTGIIETKFSSNRGEVNVKLSPAINVVSNSKNKVEVAEPTQEVVPPAAEIGANPWESRIMSFDSYVNENKKQAAKKDTEPKKKPKKDKGFPDMSGDGRVTKKDILIAKGVIKK